MSELNRLSIRLPEGVEFSLRLAGPLTRLLAWAIDMACVSAIVSGLSTLIYIFAPISRDFVGALSFLIYFIVALGYPILLEWAWRGQTVGKRVLKLRVLDASGMQLKFGQILIRNLLRFADMLPSLYLLGGVVCFFSPKNQRLGDIAAQTIVIRQNEPFKPELEKLMQGKFNSLRAHPHLAARLRNKIDPKQAATLLRVLLRRDELDPTSRLKILSMASESLRESVHLPPEIAETMSDEAHVRNTVDIIYRPRV